MIPHRKTYFISDLHLEESRPDITQQFLQFLKNRDAMLDAIYILGDLFEVWIGDDDDNAFNHSITKALKSATDEGLPIYFLHGNRDFLLGKQFMRETGCKLISDEERILLYGTPVLLMHGDTLCTQDVVYLKARKKARSRILQTLFLLLPLKLRKNYANRMRAKSMLHTKATAREIMDVTQDEVERVMQEHDAKYLIHGHTHRPAMFEFSFNQTKGMRIVLGAWHERGNVLIWDETGKKEWVEF